MKWPRVVGSNHSGRIKLFSPRQSFDVNSNVQYLEKDAPMTSRFKPLRQILFLSQEGLVLRYNVLMNVFYWTFFPEKAESNDDERILFPAKMRVKGKRKNVNSFKCWKIGGLHCCRCRRRRRRCWCCRCCRRRNQHFPYCCWFSVAVVVVNNSSSSSSSNKSFVPT